MGMSFGSYASRVVATKVVATDGTGDFTDIQAGINALPATGGGVYIKEGTYVITSNITFPNSNISLIGCGKSTKIQYTFVGFGMNINGVNGIRIQNLYLLGNNVGFQQGIRVFNSNETIVDHCWIEATGDTGIGVSGNSNRCIFSNNIIHNMDYYGLQLLQCNHIVVTGNVISSSGSDALQLGTPAGNCDYLLFSGNVIKDAVSKGIRLSDGDHCVFSNNQIYNNGDDGVFVDVGCDYNVITSNVIISNGTYGVNISNVSCDKNIIVANDLSGNTSGGITDSGTLTEIGHNVT